MREKIGKAEKLIYETHVLSNAQLFSHLDQALSINFPFVTFDLRMRDSDDQIHYIWKDGDDPGHRADHVFQSLAAVDESEGANNPPPREPQPRLMGLDITLEGHHGH